MLAHGGIPTEDSYGPYLGQDGYCRADKATVGLKIKVGFCCQFQTWQGWASQLDVISSRNNHLLGRVGWMWPLVARRLWRWRSHQGARSPSPSMPDISRSAFTATVSFKPSALCFNLCLRSLLWTRVQQHRSWPRRPCSWLWVNWRGRLLAGWIFKYKEISDINSILG